MIAINCSASSVLALVDGQRAGLQDQVVAVAVDGQAGQVVALGVDQPVDIGVWGSSANDWRRAIDGGQPSLPEILIDQFVLLPTEQAYNDLAVAIEIALGQPVAAGIEHRDDRSIGADWVESGIWRIAPLKIQGWPWRTGLSRLGLSTTLSSSLILWSVVEGAISARLLRILGKFPAMLVDRDLLVWLG